MVKFYFLAFIFLVLNPTSFTIGDTSSYSEFTKGYGIAQQVKEVLKIDFVRVLMMPLTKCRNL
jgi:hypothetical protein